MINQLNPYPAYKSSGIDWLGNIPNHWKLDRVRYLFNYEKGKKASELTLEYISNNVGNYPVFSGQTENEGLMGFINSYEFSFPSPIVIVTTVGARAMTTKLINGKFSLSQNCAIIRPVDDNIDIRFFYYQFQVLFAYEKANISLIMQPSLRFADLNRYSIVLPPLPEQKAIAAFLDHQTAKIDALIAKLERLVELLQEKRTALISQAVTKGLDPSVPMKDSGIEWLKQTQENWSLVKIKHHFYVKGRIGWKGLRSTEFIDDGPFLVTGTDFYDGVINWDSCYHVSQERYDEDSFIQLRNGDILITKDGTIGKVALVSNLIGSATLNSGVFVIRPIIDGISPNFVFWVFHSSIFSNFIDLLKLGSTIQHLYQKNFNEFSFTIPPIEEQNRISTYLSQKTNDTDDLNSKVLLLIEGFYSLKETFITCAVTGKIDVREHDRS